MILVRMTWTETWAEIGAEIGAGLFAGRPALLEVFS